MKKIKLKKKEYIVIEKSELNDIMVDLWWRIKVCRNNDEVVKVLDDKNFRNFHCDHNIELLAKCEEILSKLNKEI